MKATSGLRRSSLTLNNAANEKARGPQLSRRRLLAAAASSVALAGCARPTRLSSLLGVPTPLHIHIVGVPAARTHLSQLLDLVERGETITITRNGKPVAILAPVDRPEAAPFDEMEQFRRTHRLDGVSPRDLVEEGRRW